jgi:hypothetical protein
MSRSKTIEEWVKEVELPTKEDLADLKCISEVELVPLEDDSISWEEVYFVEQIKKENPTKHIERLGPFHYLISPKIEQIDVQFSFTI